MDNIKDYDDEGFELQFDDDTTPEEKKYYVQVYTNVNMVADRRLHCTCCDTHIGTAPSAEKLIRMHPVLRVTQCVKCFRFYNSGEFEKGEDGSELYCRWCGQGGDVYCCSSCPYVFCKKCILRNLTRVALKDVTSNENWKCFSCAPKILYHLRAQHWALMNFITKQKKEIEKISKARDQDEIADAMNQDASQCCKSKRKSGDTKKRKLAASDHSDNDSEDKSWNSHKKIKKKGSVNDSDGDTASVDSGSSAKLQKVIKKSITPQEAAAVSSIEKNPQIQVKKVSTAPKPPVVRKEPLPPVISGPSKPPVVNAEPAEIDCTPDLFAFLVNHSFEQTVGANEQPENSVSSSTGARAPTAAPERQVFNCATNSLVIPNAPSEQLVKRVARSQATQQSPVYHNYNGYRIDLNSAAQQSTVRLPNGKVIHVKKQAPIRGDQVRFSITSQQAPTQPRPVRPMVTQSSRLAPQPEPHAIHRVPLPSARPPPPRMANQLRPSTVSRAPRMQCSTQGPPPLIINSVSSAGSVPQMIGPPQHVRMNQPATMAAGHVPLQQAQMQMQQMMVQNPAHPQMVNMPGVSTGPGPSAVGHPTAPTIPAPRIYSNDQVGRARTQLERQVFNSIQICHQIEGKLKTLMNSNAYKNVKKLHDIKELYIHLSYLFTYTNGRFQSVHEKCMEDMRRLGFKNDATSLSTGNVIDINHQNKGSDVDEDDLEIVEPNHQTINLDSDDERTPEKNKAKSNPNSARKEATESANKDIFGSSSQANGPALLDISSSTENLECDVDVSSLLQCTLNEDDEEEEDENGESLLTRMNDDVGIATPPDFEQLTEATVNIKNDVKLNSKVIISLEPAEKLYPDLMEKAMQNIKESEIEKASTKIPAPEESQQQAEIETEPDHEKPEEQSVVEISNDSSDSHKENDELISSQTTQDNINQEPECTNSGVTTEQPQKEIESTEVTYTEEKLTENEQNESNKSNETIEINDSTDSTDSNQNEVTTQNEVESLPKEQQTESFKNPEPESVNDSTEKPNSPLITSNEAPDFNENEAKSTDNNSDCEAKEAQIQESSVSEITSTSTAIENENECENVVENDIEMHDVVDSNPLMIGSDQVDNEVANADIVMDEISDMNTVEVIADEISGDNSMPEDIISEEIITDEMVVEEIVGNDIVTEEVVAGNEPLNNETDSMFSDLSECNQLVNEEIANVISTSETLDVTSLLESGDFENISSPEAFN